MGLISERSGRMLLGEAQGGRCASGVHECSSAASGLSAHGTSPELGQNMNNGGIKSLEQTIALHGYSPVVPRYLPNICRDTVPDTYVKFPQASFGSNP